MIDDIENLGYIANYCTSFIDVPGQIACVIYFKGCSFKCNNCHNYELQNKGTQITDVNILINKINKKKLENWIIFQGGEPFEQNKCLQYIINNLDNKFKIGIYTGNNYNIVLKKYFWIFSNPKIKLLKTGTFNENEYITDKFLSSKNQQLFIKNKNNEWIEIYWIELGTINDISNIINNI